jgi:hypothetical protein
MNTFVIREVLPDTPSKSKRNRLAAARGTNKENKAEVKEDPKTSKDADEKEELRAFFASDLEADDTDKSSPMVQAVKHRIVKRKRRISERPTIQDSSSPVAKVKRVKKRASE